MEIDGFIGVQLYDVEFYFKGDVSDWQFTIKYATKAGDSPAYPLSGNASVVYYSTADETKISGRNQAPAFGEGGVFDVKFKDSEFGITLKS